MTFEEKAKQEEWGGWKIVSNMFDIPHPNKELAECGIYNTAKCYEELYDFVVEQKEKARRIAMNEVLQKLRETKLLDYYCKCDDIGHVVAMPRDEYDIFIEFLESGCSKG